MRGWPLFLVICLLASAPLYSRTLGQVAVGILAVGWFLTLFQVKQASAGRSSGEAMQTTEGMRSSSSP